MPLRRSAAAPGAAALPTASASAAVSGAAVALRAMATVPRCTATTRTSGARRRQRQGAGPHDVNDQLQGEHADLLAEPQPRPRSRWHGMREALRSAHPLAWPTRRRGGARAGPGGRGRRHLSQRAARQGCTCHFEAGRSFATHHDFQLQLDHWLDHRANGRRHDAALLPDLQPRRGARGHGPLPAPAPGCNGVLVLRVPPDPHMPFDPCDCSLVRRSSAAASRSASATARFSPRCSTPACMPSHSPRCARPPLAASPPPDRL